MALEFGIVNIVHRHHSSQPINVDFGDLGPPIKGSFFHRADNMPLRCVVVAGPCQGGSGAITGKTDVRAHPRIVRERVDLAIKGRMRRTLAARAYH